MHTGGTEMYCQINSSGRLCSGRKPRSSQSWPSSQWGKQLPVAENIHLVRDTPEEVQHLQWVQIFMDCLANVQTKLLLCLDGRVEGPLPGLHLYGRLLCAEFVVDDLQGSGFLHRTIRRGTVRTIHDLACSSIHSFKYRLALNIFEVQTAEPSQKHAPFGLVQQHASACLKVDVKKERAKAGANTYFTYALKKRDRVFEVPDMKYGDDELDICVVTDAVDGIEPAGLTECVLLRRTLGGTRIHVWQ